MSYDEDEAYGASAYSEFDDNDEPLEIPDDIPDLGDDLDDDPEDKFH